MVNDVRAFLNRFVSTEHAAWTAAFSEPDKTRFREATLALHAEYGPAIVLNFNRPRRPDDAFFAGEGAANLAALRPRRVFAIAAAGAWGLAYTSRPGPDGGFAHLVDRLLVRETEKGPRIVGVDFTCSLCGGSGERSGATCPECFGARWTHSQGESLPASARRTAFEALDPPTEELSKPIFAHLVAGGL